MGVDYSVTMGYGIAIYEKEAPAFLKQYENPFEDGEIAAWIDANYNYVGYDYCGNFMGGNSVFFFYVDRTYERSEHYMLEGIYEADLEGISEDAIAELVDIAQYLDLDPFKVIGYKVIGNIS